MTSPLVIAIDGTSASGKSTTARRVARHFGYTYVDTGAMYRTLAWHCVMKHMDLHDEKAVAAVCRKWKTSLVNVDHHVRMLVDGYFPESEIRTSEATAAVAIVAANTKVREWMKTLQQSCIQFGNLVMEGRDIGTAIFPDTDFKFYLDAPLAERSKRRWADGVQEDLAKRDHSDSQRASNPLMIPLGAMVINNSGLTIEQTCQLIVDEVNRRLAARNY
ncbi:MAG: (d)CMP kinase [Verrucomicrobia bacterium]|nr:(d)CMP kinase [Verrucomicrobiota bacterium]